MKRVLFNLIPVLFSIYAVAQQENPIQPGSIAEQQLENLADQQQGETEDDSYLQTLVQLKMNPIDLKTAEESDLKELKLLSDLQIQNLLRYRQLLGSFISIYELQAIPAWDIETIQKVLPYVRAGSAITLSADVSKRFQEGQHSVLLRLQQVVEKSNGYLRSDTVNIRYPGSPQKIFFRYKYVNRNLLQFGLTADKDAGEQFFKGNQKQGFDFYSFHLFARKLGIIKLLALGDYTVNLGQGLIHWQSLAFKKSANITAAKRQADILRPYNSAGEYNFMRGAGITVGRKNIDITAFASLRKLDGTLHTDTSQTSEDYISSILNSGYHRTATEVAKKNMITQTSFGANISYNKNSLHAGLNAIGFAFSVPLVRNIYSYNQYSIQGKDWYNYSFDYGYTYRNFHFFGEVAMDKNHSKAFIGGMLASLDEKVDASLVYRNIEKSYQALYGNAFTESTMPSNENGLFTGISIRPVSFFKIDAYADVFSFPWLRYRVDAPGPGSEYLLQLTYVPNKQITAFSRFRNENKAINLSNTDLATRQVYTRPKKIWQTEILYNVNQRISFHQRVDVLWFDPNGRDQSQQGFLTYVEVKYKPAAKHFLLNGRLQYFETDGFDSRLYSFERDVLYSYSIPQFFGKGFRYYINFNFNVNSRNTVWFKWSQTYYRNQSFIGSGLDKIDGDKKSEIKIQILHYF